MTTHTTTARYAKRIALGAATTLILIGTASTVAAAGVTGTQINGIEIAAPVPGDTSGAGRPAHYEPFLGAPRWNGSWSRNQ